MPPREKTRQQLLTGPAKTFIFLIFVFSLFAIVGARFTTALPGSDFPDFYAAARMIAGGHGHQIYDPEAQRQSQARFAGRVGTLYIHPPFEALLYLAVAWAPLKYAYLLWSVLNLASLAISCRWLGQEVLQPWDWRILLAVSLTFAPVALCIRQGQDSLLLLLLIVSALIALRRNRAFAAGCWLGLGLFKFHLVLPLVTVLWLRRNRSGRVALAKGFGLAALALGAVCPVISGWRVFRDYPAFLLHLRAQPFPGIFPRAMANFRGLIYFFVHNDGSTTAIAALCICSALAFTATLASGKRKFRNGKGEPTKDDPNHFDLAFADAVLFALLVSYHLNPHDLTLLLLPIAVLLHRAVRRKPRAADWITLGLAGILFLPPLHLWALEANAYALISIPMLALFIFSASTAAGGIDVS